jgi:hypothetical protein
MTRTEISSTVESSAVAAANFPTVRADEISLMFSGGVDSTAAAVQLADHFKRVHLLTYKNGYGHYAHQRSRKRAEELARRVGDRFVFSLIETKRYFDEVLVDSVLADFAEFKSGFIWCMGCKLAMHLRSAIYCLENGLLQMSDGSSSDTNEMVEQMLVSLTLVRAFYAEFGIDFGTPVYETTRAESRRVIGESKLKSGLQVLDRQLGIQPSCIAGELYYVPYILFNKKVRHDEATVARFIQQKTIIAKEIVRRHFAARRWDLDALLDDRRRQQLQLQADAEPPNPVP